MLDKWLVLQKRTPCCYKYGVVDVQELSSVDDTVLDLLAREIVLANSNPKLLHDVFQELCQDVSTLGLAKFKEFVEVRILGLAPSPKVATLIGNFGEILAARILVEFEGFWFPIYKLRFREKKDWAMRLTDLCLIKTSGLPQPLVCYGEVKTNSSQYNADLGIAGHTSLARDDALTDPEVLRFLSNVLYEAERYDEGKFILRIMLGTISFTKRHDLFLVHEQKTWSDEILARLDNTELNDEKLVDFTVKVVRIGGLRDVIDSSYTRAWKAAEAVANE